MIKSLESYNRLVGDKEKIKAKIKTLKLKLEVTGCGIKSTYIKDMPTSKNKNKNESIVESVVLSKEKLQEQILLLEITISEIDESLIKINMAILKLNQDEKFIVKKFYIQNIKNYTTIAMLYKKEFGVYKHRSTIWRKLKKAIKKLEGVIWYESK
jgi:hypothetical protein